jgi:hypothetical protein
MVDPGLGGPEGRDDRALDIPLDAQIEVAAARAGRRLRSRSRVAHRALMVAIAVVALAGVGCQRRVQLLPRDGDSTAAALADSATSLLRTAQVGWESGDNEAAALASARALQADLLGRPPIEWTHRADFLLDSLGIGADFADAPCALVVNFFSRSDPESGAWPYLYWCGEDGIEMQAIEGRGQRAQQVVARGLGGDAVVANADSGRAVAVLFSRRATSGPAPLAMTWSYDARGPKRWRLAQSLGADSLGGFGTGDFEAVSDTIVYLVTRTYRAPAGFQECTTCPHLYMTHRFRWRPGGFSRISDETAPSTYATFVQFIQALTAGDTQKAESFVTDAGVVAEAQKFDWQHPKGAWRTSPTPDESPLRLTFFRGQQESYLVRFESHGGNWLISGFDSVPRNVE